MTLENFPQHIRDILNLACSKRIPHFVLLEFHESQHLSLTQLLTCLCKNFSGYSALTSAFFQVRTKDQIVFKDIEGFFHWQGEIEQYSDLSNIEMSLNKSCQMSHEDMTPLFILHQSHNLTEREQNTLLKTLEEPRLYPEPKIIFITTDPERHLSTIRSRAVKFLYYSPSLVSPKYQYQKNHIDLKSFLNKSTDKPGESFQFNVLLREFLDIFSSEEQEKLYEKWQYQDWEDVLEKIRRLSCDLSPEKKSQQLYFYLHSCLSSKI